MPCNVTLPLPPLRGESVLQPLESRLPSWWCQSIECGRSGDNTVLTRPQEALHLLLAVLETAQYHENRLSLPAGGWEMCDPVFFLFSADSQSIPRNSCLAELQPTTHIRELNWDQKKIPLPQTKAGSSLHQTGCWDHNVNQTQGAQSQGTGWMVL